MSMSSTSTLLVRLFFILLPFYTNSFSIKAPSSAFVTTAAALAKKTNSKKKIIKGDEDYPWIFTGRLWFRPSIIKIPQAAFNNVKAKHSIQAINILGYTIGGSVALEYDTSPIGPYKEYVTMGSLVLKINNGKVYLGQWGENLYVSTKEAASICDDIWGVPAQLANIEFVEESDSKDNMFIQSAPLSYTTTATTTTATESNTKSSNIFEILFSKDKNKKQKDINNIQVNGWYKTRKCNTNDLTLDVIKNRPSIDMLWTPTIKALWLPFTLPFFQQYNNSNNNNDNDESLLPLHKLRLSADSIGIVQSNQILKDSTDGGNTDLLGFTLPFGLVVDNVAIEISRTIGKV